MAYHNVPSSGSQVDLSDMSRMSMSGPDPGLSPHTNQLKPMLLADAHASGVSSPGYSNLNYAEGLEDLEKVQRADEDIKRRIRTLRVVTRTISLLLAIAAFIPLTLTLHKFRATRNVYRQAGGIKRTAWALKTKSWPTYMYFCVSLASVIINLAILFSYRWGIKAANRAALVGTVFTWATVLGDVVVWIVVVIIYRYEKQVTEGGKHNDLWGWTCSPAARSIQKVFADQVPFDRYCNVQTAGWVAGLLQVGLLILSAIVYVLVFRRSKSKKRVKKRLTADLSGAHQGR